MSIYSASRYWERGVKTRFWKFDILGTLKLDILGTLIDENTHTSVV